jgi:Fe-S-cluster containining protein
MPKKNKNRSLSDKARRVSFPEDEKRHSWLGPLLEAYFIVDKGVVKAIEAERKKGRKLACSKGCSNCCNTHKDIPVYPLELRGIYWYVTEKTDSKTRETLKRQLNDFTRTGPCPFLIDGSCSIHLMRPMACRQFNVFGEPCSPGEDPYHSRREDVMDPVKKFVDQAFFIMLPCHGVKKGSERIRIIETGEVHRMVSELQACKWKELASKL